MNCQNQPPDDAAVAAMADRLRAIRTAEEYWSVIGHGLAQHVRLVAPRLPTALPQDIGQAEMCRLGRLAPGILFCVGAN